MTAARTAADPDQAAAAIVAARRVVVTGLVAAAAEAAVAAFDLAEACGAAVDPGSPETSQVAGPLVARIGAVTGAAAELRDRADLVVLWFCAGEPAAGSPEAWPDVTLAGSPRRVVVVGPRGAAPDRHELVAAAPDAAVDLARVVEAMVRGVWIDEAACAAPLLAAAGAVAAAIAAARCVGFVTDWRHDAVGLAAWSTTSLVRAIAHRKPAFEAPLGEREDPAIAACTWRYGAAGAIERASRDGGRFSPAEADAARLIARREIDCVVLVGEATPPVAAAIARAGAGIAVVHLPADTPTIQRVTGRVRASREAPP